MHITQQVSKARSFLNPLVYGAQDPHSSHKGMAPLMDVKLLLWRVDYTLGMSYAAMLLMSLCEISV